MKRTPSGRYTPDGSITPDTSTTPVRGQSWRTRRASSKPSIGPGMATSLTMAQTRSPSAICDSASSPVAASITSKPDCSRMSDT